MGSDARSIPRSLIVRGGLVTIERAANLDIAQVVELERASFSDPWSLASFETLLEESAALFAVARVGGEAAVAGYVVAWFAADEGEIANLAVRQPTRRTGVGAALLDAAIEEGRRRGAVAIYLEVRDSNAAARALYASQQFTEVGRRRNYYRRPVEDAIVLRRSVDPSENG